MALDNIFENLQITVVILSLPAEEQIKAMFGGKVGDELLVDFETYYCENRERLTTAGRLTPREAEVLEELNAAFPTEGQDSLEVGFYADQQHLFTHPLWEVIRNKAKAAREEMGLQAARLEIESNESEPDENGLQVIWWKPRLVWD